MVLLSVLPDNKGWEGGCQVNVCVYVYAWEEKNIVGLDIPRAHKEIGLVALNPVLSKDYSLLVI